MFQHQIHNSIGQDIYNGFTYREYSFGLHLHKGCEFLYVEKGELEAVVGDKTYLLREGAWLFCPPYSIHAYTSSKNNVYSAFVFSETETESFARFLAAKRPKEYIFYPSSETNIFALKILRGDVENMQDFEMVKKLKKPTHLALKAALYALCSEFSQQQTFENIPPVENSLIFNCLKYIENNFASDISLKGMAKELGYTHEYLSRLFHRAFRTSFKEFVNQYRLEKAQHLIVSTEKTLTDIAHESGFQSIRSFNRVFKEQTGVSPSSFKKKN